MKEKYESPMLEIFSFGVRDAIMDSGCPTYTCSGVGCPGDGVCIVETCIMDGVSSF